MLIREATPSDVPSIRSLTQMVFKGDYEADLIDNLRFANLFILSLVALDEKDVLIGHVLFSQLSVEIDGRSVKAAAMAPLAVKLNWQGQGIGFQMVGDGLNLLREKSVEAVIVLGDPNYYSRFDFSTELMQNFDSPFRGNATLMGLELTAGALAGEKGCVNYPKAFRLGLSR